MSNDDAETDLGKANALAMFNAGRLEDAKAIYEAILSQNKKDIESLNMLCVICGRLAQHDTVERLSRNMMALLPDSYDAQRHLAESLHAQGKLSEARICYERALELHPGNAACCNALGILLNNLGEPDMAETYFRKALQNDPRCGEAYLNLGELLISNNRINEGMIALQQAISNIKTATKALVALGKALLKTGATTAASTCFRSVLEQDIVNHDDFLIAGNLLLELGDAKSAVACYNKLIAHGIQNVDYYCNLGLAYHILGDLPAATAAYNGALSINHDNPDALSGLASVLERKGDCDQAYALVAPLINAGCGRANAILTFAQLCTRYHSERKAILALQELVQRDGVSEQHRIQAFFALGKLFDSLGEYDNAFKNYHEGNALKRYPYDHLQHKAAIQQLKATFSLEFMAHAPRANNRNETPVFIIGMPRSGTSLVEQILASHPQIHGAGELEGIMTLANEIAHKNGRGISYPQCVQNVSQDLLDKLSTQYINYLTALSKNAIRITDKLPGNVYHLGLIDMLFPGARIIHIMRDPLDTCLSCYFQNFVSGHYYSYDLSNLGAYYKNYLHMIQHWRESIRNPVLEIRYEDLIQDQENIARKLISFCGLKWSPHCLQFNSNKRSVATASYDQVRRPIYSNSVGRWHNYDRHLGPLKTALGIGSNRNIII